MSVYECIICCEAAEQVTMPCCAGSSCRTCAARICLLGSCAFCRSTIRLQGDEVVRRWGIYEAIDRRVDDLLEVALGALALRVIIGSRDFRIGLMGYDLHYDPDVEPEEANPKEEEGAREDRFIGSLGLLGRAGVVIRELFT
eukprot:gnl/TRDRNA2_/TRDRNA2_74336_c0_seq1.p1 gnl/TRDRNA2_/TRDRNA2_74336_c0~~gnl/TRDRNA2_/TRDRNA2_74336_c0_seq1.p1  ORF type:complete len:142 (-),score=12.66 gnl/TRDRNA2_/TRDRNA2_74336_c0_seq1:182-607(-)